MTATRPDWRVKVRRGDVVKLSGTYDVSQNSWYESMAINFLVTYAGTDVGGVDPFTGKLDPRGDVTHGHLAENDNHGGDPASIRNASTVPSQPSTGAITLAGFLASQGDLRRATGDLPTIHQGNELTFINSDASRDIFHTITGCRLPCNDSTGIAYPRADGPVDFDSGELGVGPQGFTAASGRTKWSTPATLPTGTYTYFCRIHPFMRGGFRVVK
jgi:plastocyanin